MACLFLKTAKFLPNIGFASFTSQSYNSQKEWMCFYAKQKIERTAKN